MLNNILSKINSQTKEFIGITLNSNGLLEVIITSRSNNSVSKYTNRFIEYNPITREVNNYDNLRNEIESALDELKISPKNCNVTLVMPNVIFGISTLPEMLSGDEIASALTSEVEESYIFKKEDPVISWEKLNDSIDSDDGMQKIVYSAIQESALNELRRISTELGIKLISVQSSISALFKGLSFTDVVNKVTKGEKSPWNVLLISSTSYSIFNFVGDKLCNYFEEPLAVKSFTDEEVYSAVSSMASVSLQNFAAANLLVISETDEVSAEVISTKLGFDGIPYYIEQNKFQQSPPIDVDLNVLPTFIPQITITAVGSSVDHFESKFFKFNYLITKDGSSSFEAGDLITIGDFTFELTKEKAQIITVALVCTFLIIFGLACLFLSQINSKINEKLNTLIAEETRLQQELNQNQNQQPTINIETTIESIIKANRKKMLYYDALSYGIPEKLWIEHFYAGPNNAIGINGVAVDSGDIALFLKGIREVAGESRVSVTKLTISGDDEINSTGKELYSFELASQSYNSTNQSQTNQSQAQPQPQQNINSQQLPPANSPSVPPPIIPSGK